MNEDELFEVGRRYRNGLGEYEVLSIAGTRLTARFNDGSVRDLDLPTQQRIWRRLQEQQRPVAPPPRATRPRPAGSRQRGPAHQRQPAGGFQHWLKPQGVPNAPVDESEALTMDRYRIGFARRPAGIEVGDVLIVYRIGIAMIQYAAEAMEDCREATAQEIEREPWRERWGWLIEVRNLTPAFGARWRQVGLRPRPLAGQYSALHPGDPVSLGALNYGADKLKISAGFGEYLLEQMQG